MPKYTVEIEATMEIEACNVQEAYKACEHISVVGQRHTSIRHKNNKFSVSRKVTRTKFIVHKPVRVS